MKILIEESVLRQALGALGGLSYADQEGRGVVMPERWMVTRAKEAITALRSEIEAAENVEPVGEMVGHHNYASGKMPTIRWRDGFWPNMFDKFYTHPAPAVPSYDADKWQNDAAGVMAQFIHLSAQPDEQQWGIVANEAVRLLNAASKPEEM